jgi:hypothetical protein
MLAHPRCLLQFLPQNLVAGPLGFRWFGVGVRVDAWCLQQRCSGRAPPFGLSVVLLGLW